MCNNKKCLVVASKDIAYEPQNDPYNRIKIYPENDYLLFILKDLLKNEYCGIFDVLETQIEDDNW